MIPDLFAGQAAASAGTELSRSAAAWPTAAAGATDPAAQSDTPSDAFADLLAATIAPQADSVNQANSATQRTFALPVSLPDVWLGLAMAVPSESEIPEEAADDLEAFTGDVEDEAPIDASSSVPVAAAETAVAVPIIVHVPTDIMSAAPVQETASTPQPVARGLTPRQDAPAGHEGPPYVTEGAQQAPVDQPTVAGDQPGPVGRGFTPRQLDPAGREGPPYVTKPEASRTGGEANREGQAYVPESAPATATDASQQSPQPVGRGLTPRQVDPAGREGPPYATEAPQQSPQPVGRGFTPRQADPDTKSVNIDAKPANVDAKAVNVDTKALNVDAQHSPQSVGRGFTPRQADPAGREGPPYGSDASGVAPVSTTSGSTTSGGTTSGSTTSGSTVPEQPDADVAASGRGDAPRTGAREGVPSGPMTAVASSKPQPAQTGPDQSQVTGAPGAPVTAAEAPEQAAQITQAAQAVVGRGFTPRQDDPAGRQGPPYVTERGATAVVEGVASAVSSQQGGDASQNGAGQQPSQDVPRDVAPATRPVDLPVATGPQAVTAAEPAAKPVVQAAAPLPPFTPAQETENMGRLVESMRVQWRQGVPEATIRLNPEHLGEVTISIRVDRGVVSATVRAETPAVQQWIEAQEDKLRNGLANQGLNLERFVVQRERQPQERREQRPHQQARYRQPQEQGQRFEVTV